MEYFSKNSIRDLIDTFGPFKESLVKKLIKNLVIGVLHCQYRNVMHNRLNFDTIFLNK